MNQRLRELRELARVSIADAAALAGGVYTTLQNFETGHGRLTDRQIKVLEAHYAPLVSERLKHISAVPGGSSCE
jgi:hypothetical protein